MRFERELIVPLSPEKVWAVLWDIEAMVNCIQGCSEASVVEDKKRYKALITEKVGPFKLEVPLDVEIGQIDPPRNIQLVATGKDNRIGTEITLNMDLKLVPQDSQTHCYMTIDAGVVGRLASLGQGVIKLKGKQSMDHFANSLIALISSQPG